MLVSTKAIVLSKLKYKDHDLIVKCYTQQLGIQSFLIKNVLKSKKGKFNIAYFQVLSLLDLNYDYRSNASLQYLKELKLNYNYSTLHTNINKTSIALFLSEVLSRILKEEEENSELYRFLETSFLWLDQSDSDNSFHLIFLMELTKYLGFYPAEVQDHALYFDLEAGEFSTTEKGNYCISGKTLTYLKQLLGIKFDVNKKLQMSLAQKRELLNMILLYFKLHLDGFKKPKSLEVLNQIYSS
ncbi:MAG: DNA repair protein RecO [Flavobacteriaceae bacterium]|nr:DNA repair protein RecO [Flavobacteriaceae bacterium]